MTSHPLRRTLFIAALACASAALLAVTGCGGNNDDDDLGSASVRVFNATVDLGALDVTIDSGNIDETVLAAGVNADSADAYRSLAVDTYTVRLRRAGTLTTLASTALVPSKDVSHTFIAHGLDGTLGLRMLTDDEADPSAGRAKVRIFNSGTSSGVVDVYLTDATTSLDSVAPTLGAVGATALSSFADLLQGDYRLRVTSRDDKSNVLLDVASLSLADKSIVTLVLQPTAGGVLVSVLALPQKGTPVAYKNTEARVRLAAGLTENAGVSAQVGATSVNFGLPSPTVGNYTRVAAGTQAVSLTVNNALTLGGSAELRAGSDYTLMVYGEASAPQYRLVSDDNRLPTTARKARMRLAHGLAGAGSLTLAKDYSVVASGIGLGAVSEATLVDSASSSRLEVTTPFQSLPLFLNETAALAEGGVYTVFMLGSSAAPVGILRRDR